MSQDTLIMEWKAIKRDISRLAFKDSWTRQDSMNLQNLIEESKELDVHLINKGYTPSELVLVTPQGTQIKFENA